MSDINTLEAAVQELKRASPLRKVDDATYERAREALAAFGAAAVPALVGLLSTPEYRWDAAHVIFAMPTGVPRDAIYALIEALADHRPGVRWMAILAISKVGPAEALARPAIERLRADPDPITRMVVGIALARVPGDGVPQFQATAAGIEVRWPDGSTELLSKVEARAMLHRGREVMRRRVSLN
jgi:glycerol kinase